MKRREFLKSVTALAAGSVLPAAPAVWSPAKAQSRQETLLIVSESGPNNLDIHGVGTNVPGYEVSWNCYDRLISHEMKTLPNGTQYYERDKFKLELADDMNIGDMSVTFKLKKNAVFQDGTPVTAKDVKWSLDRAVTVGGFPTFQMGAGSLTKPEQFVVVDDNTIRVDFLRKDRLTLPDLAVIVPAIYNSELVKKHASEKDPWGLEYAKQNTAGSGAYRVVSWNAGSEVILERNDKWIGGPPPKVRRIVWRMVPSAGNRRALLERGDADISYDLPNKDFVELKDSGKLAIVSTPYSNGIQYIGMNVKTPPFDNLKVRQAVAYAIPYQKIMDAVLFGLAAPMFGAAADAPTVAAWPQPHKYNTDIAKAKALLAEAGYPNGFETTLSFDLGFAGVNEPLCVLTQESLAQIGIKCTINKIPGATWRAAALHQRVLGLARLSRILLHLVLSRQEFDLQHHELPVEGARRADRRRRHRGGRGRQGVLREGCEGLRRSRLRRHAAHPALPAVRQRRDAEERVGLPVLVPPTARLPRAGEGMNRSVSRRVFAARLA
jgi:peptide/nickel transport system substrate-binding protein